MTRTVAPLARSAIGFCNLSQLFCNSVCLCAVAFLCPKFGAGFPALPCPRQQFVAMATLGEFLQTNGLTDPKIINYETRTLQLASASDFASYWTGAEYEKGVQTDIVQQIADVSLPSSKLPREQLQPRKIMMVIPERLVREVCELVIKKSCVRTRSRVMTWRSVQNTQS